MIVSPSILITDDDRGFRETLRGIFEPRGFCALVAADGEEALSIVRSREIHLLVSDLHMPKLSGLETIRLVRELNAALPCILMSAEADAAIEASARELSVTEVLAKPISAGDITRAVRAALETSYDWARPELG
ncbi:MAG: response regulator [Pirellulales bacterium]